MNTDTHSFGQDGFCIHCHNVHQTDNNARSTNSDGFTCSTSVADNTREPRNETREVVWLTPAQRREKYATETPKKKRGRPYKNPNLIPQGLANYIRKLEKENADLRTQIEQTKADNQDAT